MPELAQKFNVSSLGLFGSYARQDYSLNSDLDIIVDFSKPVGIEFIDLANFLEKKIRMNIDLVSRKGIKEKYFQEIEKDVVYV